MGQMACRSVVVRTNVMGSHPVGMFCNQLCTPLGTEVRLKPRSCRGSFRRGMLTEMAGVNRRL
jgi:hypothetical protein